jgi:GNAT superfamily N-acetyltransferase
MASAPAVPREWPPLNSALTVFLTTPVITLEAVTPRDAESLAALRIEAMRESLERVGRFDPQRARARFLDSFDPQFTRGIVHGGERVGFLVLRPHLDMLLLDHLYVRPSHQNRGIGAAVLQVVFAEADACEKALRVGALRASAANRFYQAHGFEYSDEGEFDIYYVRRIVPTTNQG